MHPKSGHKVNKNLSLLKLLPTCNGDVSIAKNHCNNVQSPEIGRLEIAPTKLYPIQKNHDKVNKLLTNNSKSKILIAPGSVWFTKRWPLENYYLLIKKLIENGYMVILSGSIAESGINDYIYQKIIKEYPEKKDSIVCTTGKFDILDTAAMMEKVDLVICNDSGTLHIANASQTPVFAFFGPTVKEIGYFPFGEKDHVFEVDLPCRPCGSHGGHKCPKGHFNCMKMINADIVFEKVKEYF